MYICAPGRTLARGRVSIPSARSPVPVVFNPKEALMRSTPQHADSVGKLLHRLALLTGEEVLHDGKPVLETPRKELLIQPALAREFTCVAGCSACCLPFTLDFTPEEFKRIQTKKVEKRSGVNPLTRFSMRKVNVNGSYRTVFSYPQYLDDQCPFLAPIREGGAPGCSFYDSGTGQPLECAAAPQLLMSTRG